LTTIRIDEPNVADTTDNAAQLSPVLSQRRWEQEAEANVLERLEAIGLLAPAGEADKVLETVLNNLVVTNKLNLERPLHARILLTSPLESFTVGHTIVMSRGLIDVLPDEASLATMLAHELEPRGARPPVDRHEVLVRRSADGVGRRAAGDAAVPPHPKEEAAADEKVVELLGKSPYRDKLADAEPVPAHALREGQAAPSPDPAAYRRRHGGRRADDRLVELMKQAPPLMPDSLEQITALQLGARLIVDTWSGRVTLDRSPAVPLMSVREKVPFAVTPLMPVIRYAAKPPDALRTAATGER
jgi:hypothetical protein